MAAVAMLLAVVGSARAQSVVEASAGDLSEPPPEGCPPLDDPRLSTGFLTPADRDQLLAALESAGASACAVPLLDHARDTGSLGVIRLIGPAFESWGDPFQLPELYRLYGDSMLSPFGRQDDMALSAAEAIRALRALQGEPLVQVEWPDVRAEWLGLAHDRFVAEWSVGALDAAPPESGERDEYIRLAGEDFEACLADPASAPRDPFDPLLRSATASSELSASTRCAAMAILDTWVTHGTPAWSENIGRLLDHYPNMDHWGPLALDLERRWGQQVLEPGEAPVGDREAWASAEGSGGWLAAVLVAIGLAFVGLAVWQRERVLRRAVVFRVGAVVVGFGLLAVVEGVLVIAGLPPGDALRPVEDCVLDEYAADGEQVVVLDKRNRGFSRPRPEGVARVAVVGASTIAGPGLPFEETIPGVLQELLGDDVEVVALGIYGIDSPWVRSWAIYAVERLEVDLVVVYSGHNEVGVTREQLYTGGLGPPAWWMRAQGRARRTRLAGVLMPLLGKDRVVLDEDGTREQGEPAGAELDLSTHHEGFERRVSAGFEVEITDLVRAVRQRGAEVVLVQPSFNHHGLRVPANVSSIDPAREAQGQDLVFDIEAALRGGDPAALQRAEELVELVPEHATPYLLHALAAEDAGDLEAAEASTWEASRRNHGGSAITPGVAGALIELARREDVVLVDAHAALHEASPGHLPGFGLYWDFVHFNAAGAAIVATEVARVIEREGLLD